MSTLNFRPFARKALMAVAVVAVMGGAVAAPAMAEDWHRGGHEHFDRHVARRVHNDWRWRHDRYAYAGPAYRYYAPPAYYSPPALSFVFPIR